MKFKVDEKLPIEGQPIRRAEDVDTLFRMARQSEDPSGYLSSTGHPYTTVARRHAPSHAPRSEDDPTQKCDERGLLEDWQEIEKTRRSTRSPEV